MKNSKIVINHGSGGILARLYADGKSSPTRVVKIEVDADIKSVLDRLLHTPSYKPGDKVRIIGDSCFHGRSIGSIITLYERGKEEPDVWWPAEGVTCVRERDIEPYVEPLKPESWSGKVVCIENKIQDWVFIVGKIYEVVNGKIIDEFGAPRPGGEHAPYITCPGVLTLGVGYFAHWLYKFIPLVED